MSAIKPDTDAILATVRRAYDAYSRGDLAGFLEPFDPGVIWEEPSAGEMAGGRFVGTAAIAREVFGRLESWHQDFSIELLETVGDGEGRVVALGSYHGRGPDSEPVSSSFAHVWRFEGGRAVQFRDFHDRGLRIGMLEDRIAGAIAETAESLAAALSAKDGYTAAHASAVADLAVAVADRLGLSGDAARAVRYGALLHDIGKIAVPDAILHKPGRLTAAEWAVVQRHPEAGEGILAPLSFLRSAREIVRHDHERWDGAGYPDGLAGERIPLGARIVLAADAYHAMRSARPYRAALSAADARAELLRGAGSQFDPRVVAALLDELDD